MQRAEKRTKPVADTAQRRTRVAHSTSGAGIHNSPRMVAQRQQLRAIFGAIAPAAPTVIQRRAEDPYELGGDSPQVHHIIAHSKLVGGLAKLGAQDQADVKRGFMPSLGSITIRQLLNANDRLVVTTSNVKFVPQDRTTKKADIYPTMTWIDEPLTKLNDQEITIDNPLVGFNHCSLAAWKASYELVRRGQAPVVGSADFWGPLQESYTEWSGGNLFLGAQKRVEPGGSDFDAFDSDAKYFRDPKHVEKLHALSLRLAAAGDDTNTIKAVLLEIGSLCKDVGAGKKNDRSKWFSAKTDVQKALIVSLLEPGPRRDFLDIQGKYDVLPVDYVFERIDSKARSECSGKPAARRTHSVLAYLQQNGGVPTIKGLTFRRTHGKHGTKIFIGGLEGVSEVLVGDSPRQTMDSMQTILNDQLNNVVAAITNRLKKDLGF